MQEMPQRQAQQMPISERPTTNQRAAELDDNSDPMRLPTSGPHIEYLAQIYDSIAEFNNYQNIVTSHGWRLKDFRVIPSPNPRIQNGLLAMWEREWNYNG